MQGVQTDLALYPMITKGLESFGGWVLLAPGLEICGIGLGSADHVGASFLKKWIVPLLRIHPRFDGALFPEVSVSYPDFSDFLKKRFGTQKCV